jgi:hypothetical protein
VVSSTPVEEGPLYPPTAVDGPGWFFELHPAILEMVENDGDVPMLATRYCREAERGEVLVQPEFELMRDGKALVEFDFAIGTSQGHWLGEAKSIDNLKRGGAALAELNKLLNGAETLGAVGLILATSKPEWSPGTVQAVGEAVESRAAAGTSCPTVLQLTGLGSSSSALATFTGRPVAELS